MAERMSPLPWDNPNDKFDFDILIIKSWSEETAVGPETFLRAVQLSFTSNKWIFSKFLEEYDVFILPTEYEVFTLQGYTWSQFCAFLHANYSTYEHEEMNYRNHYIMMSYLPIIDKYIPATSDLFSEVEQDEYCSAVESMATPLLVAAKILFDNEKYFKNVEQIRSVRRILERAVDIYITLYYLCINSEYNDGGSGDWFLQLPDEFKVDMTRKANFPRLIEEIDWNEFMTEDFNLMVWLRDMVGYPEPDGESVVKGFHAKFGSEISTDKIDQYANMIRNYCAGYGILYY